MSAIAMPDLILTIDEIAARLKVNRKTVVSLIDQGKLIAFRVGRNYRIMESEYYDYIKREQITPPKERQ